MSSENKDRRILIVDDQKLFAETLKRALVFEKFPRVECETSLSEHIILSKVASYKPDLILMDIHLQHLDGFVLSKEILRKDPHIIVLMLTAFGYEDYIQKAMNLGVSGILLKDVSMDELINSIILSSNEGFLVSNRMGMAEKTLPAMNTPSWLGNMSPKDRDILRMIAHGYSNAEISETLNLGKQTVKNYVSKLYSQMNVTNRFQAIRTILEDIPEFADKHFSHEN